jgi:predicted nucleic acid-binding protein
MESNSTNITIVIVSAAISSDGNPAKIIKLVSVNENMQIYYSPAILDEYKM